MVRGIRGCNSPPEEEEPPEEKLVIDLKRLSTNQRKYLEEDEELQAIVQQAEATQSKVKDHEKSIAKRMVANEKKSRSEGVPGTSNDEKTPVTETRSRSEIMPESPEKAQAKENSKDPVWKRRLMRLGKKSSCRKDEGDFTQKIQIVQTTESPTPENPGRAEKVELTKNQSHEPQKTAPGLGGDTPTSAKSKEPTEKVKGDPSLKKTESTTKKNDSTAKKTDSSVKKVESMKKAESTTKKTESAQKSGSTTPNTASKKEIPLPPLARSRNADEETPKAQNSSKKGHQRRNSKPPSLVRSIFSAESSQLTSPLKSMDTADEESGIMTRESSLRLLSTMTNMTSFSGADRTVASTPFTLGTPTLDTTYTTLGYSGSFETFGTKTTRLTSDSDFTEDVDDDGCVSAFTEDFHLFQSFFSCGGSHQSKLTAGAEKSRP